MFVAGLVTGWLLRGRSQRSEVPAVSEQEMSLYDEVRMPAGEMYVKSADGRVRKVILVDPNPGAPEYDR